MLILCLAHRLPVTQNYLKAVKRRWPVAALTAPEASAKDGEEMIGLAEYSGILPTQSSHNDNELRPIIEYLKNGNLPDEEKVARELTLNKKQYVLMDDILYHLVSESDTLKGGQDEYYQGSS